MKRVFLKFATLGNRHTGRCFPFTTILTTSGPVSNFTSDIHKTISTLCGTLVLYCMNCIKKLNKDGNYRFLYEYLELWLSENMVEIFIQCTKISYFYWNEQNRLSFTNCFPWLGLVDLTNFDTHWLLQTEFLKASQRNKK